MSNNSLAAGMNIASQDVVNSVQTKNSGRQIEINKHVESSKQNKTENALQNEEAKKVQPSAVIDKQELAKATEELTERMAITRKSISFEVNENSHEPIVSVRDADTGEVIRQIPSEEALKIAERIAEMRGLLLDEKV